jgi:L-seryl-tRNA(Ser) seleniumtransferase
MSDPRRLIPSVDRLLASGAFAELLRGLPRDLVRSRLQHETDRLRRGLERQVGVYTHDAAAELPPRDGDPAWYAERVRASIDGLVRGSLFPVLNATGVVLHTNLGRAPLADAALTAIRETAAGYSTLEYDLASGGRGSRYDHCRELIAHLTGAEDALVVNNNAAALVLALNTIARGLDAIISRGELVEIGGSFRIPEIMARSGARLREVGATNRTHVGDYRDALSPAAGVILKVHPSNFTMEGYTAEASPRELAAVAREGGVPLLHDIGSGLLLDPELLGLSAEPTPRASLAEGADIVTFSGDKLLGGPQCGIVVGDARLVERMRRNPLCRALRVDKLTLAALTATLRLYLEPATALRDIPVLRMLRLGPAELEPRAAALAARLRQAGVDATVAPGHSAVGGGAAPGAALPTTLVLLAAGAQPATALERRLRGGAGMCVIARIIGDRLALDLRTVPPASDEALSVAVTAAFAEER